MALTGLSISIFRRRIRDPESVGAARLDVTGTMWRRSDRGLSVGGGRRNAWGLFGSCVEFACVQTRGLGGAELR